MEDEVERRFLIRQPRALQYFHNGKLKRASEKERVSGRFELFFDLLYVALIANFAEFLTEEPTGARLVQFILTFTPAWHAWADAKENANNYYNDDIVQRIGILWVMALLVLYGNNANFVAEDIGSLRTTVAAYMVLRFTQISFFLYYSFASHYHRAQNRVYFGMICAGLCLWIPLYFEEVSIRAKIAVTVVAIVWEEFSYVFSFGPWITKLFNLQYSTAVDIDHENDRYTAFTIIVLGEFTYAILVGSPARGHTTESTGAAETAGQVMGEAVRRAVEGAMEGGAAEASTGSLSALNTGLLRAVWTLVIAFCFNAMYDYCDGSRRRDHPIRRSIWTAFPWLLIHLPLSAGLLIGGHVSAASVLESEMGSGRRWLWGGGLGTGMLCMWIIAMMYHDKDEPKALYFSKMVRIGPRLAVAIVLALLPLSSEEHLDSTSLISIGAALTGFVVIWESVGALSRDACQIFERWSSEHTGPMPRKVPTNGLTAVESAQDGENIISVEGREHRIIEADRNM